MKEIGFKNFTILFLICRRNFHILEDVFQRNRRKYFRQTWRPRRSWRPGRCWRSRWSQRPRLL